MTLRGWRRLRRLVVTAATVVLALVGGVRHTDDPWVLVVAGVCAAAVVVFECVVWRQEASAESVLGNNYEIVLSRVLSLISDLADLTAREFDLWVVDLYLPRRALLGFVGRRVQGLHLAIHVSLTDVRAVPSRVGRSECVGQCYWDGQAKLWWNIEWGGSVDENCWRSLSEDDNRRMAESYGYSVTGCGTDFLQWKWAEMNRAVGEVAA